MLKAILTFHDAITDALSKGASLQQLLDLPVKTEIARMKEQEDVATIKGLLDTIDTSVASLEVAQSPPPSLLTKRVQNDQLCVRAVDIHRERERSFIRRDCQDYTSQWRRTDWSSSRRFSRARSCSSL